MLPGPGQEDSGMPGAAHVSRSVASWCRHPLKSIGGFVPCRVTRDAKA